jgi:hypothetical protein
MATALKAARLATVAAVAIPKSGQESTFKVVC